MFPVISRNEEYNQVFKWADTELLEKMGSLRNEKQLTFPPHGTLTTLLFIHFTLQCECEGHVFGCNLTQSPSPVWMIVKLQVKQNKRPPYHASANSIYMYHNMLAIL